MMITTMVQHVTGFTSSFTPKIGKDESYGTSTVQTNCGSTIVFYDSAEMVRDHAAILTALADQMDEHQTTEWEPTP